MASAQNGNFARLELPSEDQSYEAPVREPVLGPPVIDVRRLYDDRGFFTFDPGYASTASCASAITFIDGENGILLHRGYPIDCLARNSDFLEVVYLLLHGELPTSAQKRDFDHTITYHTMLHEQFSRFLNGFRHDAHPMALVCGSVGALSAFYHDSTDIADEREREIACHRLIAKMPTIVAMAYKYFMGQPFMYPSNSLGYAENFMKMTFGVPTEEYDVNPTLCRAMDRILILHADHEQNASTSTMRLAGSTGANPFACTAAAVAALWGPAHGGANEAVLNLLEEIGSKDRVPRYIEKAKDEDDPFRLMGFGHRVYKSYDPRAKVMQDICHEVLDELQVRDEPLLEIALELERIALEDDYFVEKGLYPNVDFYSGITLRSLGFPKNMFSALFALARTAGWLAHWKEMIEDPDRRIGRPRQLYVGHEQRDYVPLEDRE